MATVTKDALYPGSYCLPNKRWVHFPPRLVRHLKLRLGQMLAAGLHIPISWNHQDDALPMTDDERLAGNAKYNAGFVTRAALLPGNVLKIEGETEPDDALAMRKARYVSPEIVHDYVDSTGKLWPGPSITHFAVTTRPINPNQRPFEIVRMSKDAPTAGRRVRVSIGAYKATRLGADLSCKRYGRIDMADDTLAGGAGDGTQADLQPETDDITPDDATGADDGTDSEFETEPMEQKIQDVIGLLAQPPFNMPLPEDTGGDLEVFIDRLHTALLTKQAHEASGASGMGDQGQEPLEPAAGAAPIAMSAEQRTSMLEQRLVASEQKSATLERAEHKRRVRALFATGRINGPLRDKLSRDLDGIQLSAEVPATLLSRIEAYEALPKGHVFGGNGRKRLSAAAKPPEGHAGGVIALSDEQVMDGIRHAMKHG